MGKKFDIFFGTLGVGALSAREALNDEATGGDDTGHEAGIRINPQVTVRLGGFFASAGFEAGVSDQKETPIGSNYFDTYPDLSLIANVGYVFRNGIQVKGGRFYAQRTDLENNLVTNNAYDTSGAFANVIVPNGWGAELRWHQETPFRLLADKNFAFDYLRGDADEEEGFPAQHLFLAQGALIFNFGGVNKEQAQTFDSSSGSEDVSGEPADNLHLTLAGNYAVRSGVPDSGGPLKAGATLGTDSVDGTEELVPIEYEGKGISHGGAVAVQLDWPSISILSALGWSGGDFVDAQGFRYGENRNTLTLSATGFLPSLGKNGAVEPFIRAAYMYLNQGRTEYFPHSGALGFNQNEHHGTLALSLNFWRKQLMLTGAYHFMRGEIEGVPVKSDKVFIGLQTSIQCALDFSKKKNRFRCDNF